MMNDLGIEMIFANTPEAKGRVERYNGTVQNRLPNDMTRFNIKNYEELNDWFNEFYIPCINRKFSYIPLDAHNTFIPVDDYNLSKIFNLRFSRVIKNDMFSINNNYYFLIDDNGEAVHIINGTSADIRIDMPLPMNYLS